MITSPQIFSASEHYNNLPFTTELTGLFEPDTFDIANNTWGNKITGGNDMTLVGGAVSDNALLFTSGQYGYVQTAFPYTYYVVFKKPSNDYSKCMFGSRTSGTEPYITGWYEERNSGQSIQIATGATDPNTRRVYWQQQNAQNYHVLSVTTIDNDNDANDVSLSSSSIHLMVDNVYQGCLEFYRDITDKAGYTNYNGYTALNTRATDYANQACTNDSYYKAFAFGGKQTMEQMIANHKYLYDKYCT